MEIVLMVISARKANDIFVSSSLHMKKHVPGTTGYKESVKRFTRATLGLDFLDLYNDFIGFIPSHPVRILDIGAGIGRDAAEFAKLGHEVEAVEPTDIFRITGLELYKSINLHWINDSLPRLENLSGIFQVAVAMGVWHHLDEHEQSQSMMRVAELLEPGGIFILTLRNGPAGMGTHIFPTNGAQTLVAGAQCGFKPALFLENESSLMPGKDEVKWTKLVLIKG